MTVWEILKHLEQGGVSLLVSQMEHKTAAAGLFSVNMSLKVLARSSNTISSKKNLIIKKYLPQQWKDTVGLHVAMDDVLCVEIAGKQQQRQQGQDVSGFLQRATRLVFFEGRSLHALSRLPGDVNELDDLEVCLQDVDVLVEAAALTPLGHDGQVVLRHVAHEQQDVDVPGLPAVPGGGGEHDQSEVAG